MWFDALGPGKSWTALWHDYVLCACGGIRTFAACARCDVVFDTEPRTVVVGGREVSLTPTFMGAEGRYEDYVYLAMIEREWHRDDVQHPWLDAMSTHRPSSRAGVVLLFWTYFETRIGRLLRAGLTKVPTAIADDWLDRNWKITSRMNQAYGILFDGRSYQRDLHELGYDDVWRLLEEVRVVRNSFAHGHPEAITDDIVRRVVENLKREHEAWIAVFNARAPRS